MEQEQFKKIASLFLNEIEPELFQAKDFYELEQISQQLFKKLFKETMDLHLNPHEIVDQRKKKHQGGMGRANSER